MGNRIYLHIGPHKTGTTAVQHVLLQSQDVINYPAPLHTGPGHAEIAWRALGLTGDSPQTDLLLEIVDQWSQIKTQPFVFSSESFVNALNQKVDSTAIVKLAQLHEVDLVVTITPLVDRACSWLQECIKHGSSIDFFDKDQILNELKDVPAFHENFFQRVSEVAQWKKIHVVFADKHAPNFIVDSFTNILGVALRSKLNQLFANERWPYKKIEILSDINSRYGSEKIIKNQKIAEWKYHKLLASNPDLAMIGYPEIPCEVTRYLEVTWAKQISSLMDLQRQNKVKVYIND